MNPITTFVATALVLFAIGQGIAAARADDDATVVQQNFLYSSAGEGQANEPIVSRPDAVVQVVYDLAAPQ